MLRINSVFLKHAKRLKTLDTSSLPLAFNQTQSALIQGVLDFREEGGPSLTFTQAYEREQLLEGNGEFVARVNEAFSSASGKPFAKEALRKARRWLHFRGLVTSEATAGSELTLAQQIVRYLRNEAFHGFRLCMSDGNTIILKGILLLVAIAHLHEVRIVIFSTRRKPVEIIPDTWRGCLTVAFLNHQDSILSVGTWYPLGLAQNWVKRTATIHKSTLMPMTSPPAIQISSGAAPKRKARADYKSINDNTLKNLLRIVM